MQLDDNGVNNLVSAIVKKAVDDWKQAKKKLGKNPQNVAAHGIVIDCERFFLSEYFYQLTGLDGHEFLKRLRLQKLDVRRRWQREKE